MSGTVLVKVPSPMELSISVRQMGNKYLSNHKCQRIRNLPRKGTECMGSSVGISVVILGRGRGHSRSLWKK